MQKKYDKFTATIKWLTLSYICILLAIKLKTSKGNTMVNLNIFADMFSIIQGTLFSTILSNICYFFCQTYASLNLVFGKNPHKRRISCFPELDVANIGKS